ncbi:MAG TPA: hypothetical protein VGD46_14735 [Rhizobacter sp.]
MSDKTRIKLTGAKNFHFGGVRYEKGVVYWVDASVAEELLDKAIDDDEDNGFYFTEAGKRDADKPAVTPKPSEDTKPKAGTAKAAKKAAKKTVKVGGGKIEGLDTKEDEGGDEGGEGDDSGEGTEV